MKKYVLFTIALVLAGLLMYYLMNSTIEQIVIRIMWACIGFYSCVTLSRDE